ncbi:hypothetical protein NE237_020225 [Protea cynaroides]|uniref:Uncharacterized protein n=1 Tax=Protea cynaroides TaxID=273540 RepID=A0A9Q0H6U3_9MAGN|nr:hypothetical protein NE237_020225 [Protea cynaroides]
MTGRRDGLLMRNNGQLIYGSRIDVAIAIEILLGCIFAFFFPHGVCGSYPPIHGRRAGKNSFKYKMHDQLVVSLRFQNRDPIQSLAFLEKTSLASSVRFPCLAPSSSAYLSFGLHILLRDLLDIMAPKRAVEAVAQGYHADHFISPQASRCWEKFGQSPVIAGRFIAFGDFDFS